MNSENKSWNNIHREDDDLEAHLRGCIQKFPDWQPGARTPNGTTLCHSAQLYRCFVSRSSEFSSHNRLCGYSTSVYFCCCLLRYRLSPETFGYTLVKCYRTATMLRWNRPPTNEFTVWRNIIIIPFWNLGKFAKYNNQYPEAGSTYVTRTNKLVKCKGGVIFALKNHFIKTQGEKKKKSHEVLTSALDGSKWPLSRSGLFKPGKIFPDTHWIGGW